MGIEEILLALEALPLAELLRLGESVYATIAAKTERAEMAAMANATDAAMDIAESEALHATHK